MKKSLRAKIFARSDFFPLSLSFRLKPSGTNRAQTKEKSRFARKYSLVENRLKAYSGPQCRLISPNIAQYRLISPNIAQYCLLSPNIAHVTWECRRLFNHLVMENAITLDFYDLHIASLSLCIYIYIEREICC